MTKSDKVVLVIGATGNQGGATARALLAAGWQVRTLTRNTEKPAAQALKNQGVELLAGSFDDPATLEAALQGVYGVFSVQSFAEVGTAGETRQGIAIAQAAKEAGVQHFVYTSVGGAERQTAIPHFESKWQVEEAIRKLELPYTILRPVFFMDNFALFMGPRDIDGKKVLIAALPANRPLQMIAAQDIGTFAAIIFANPHEYLGKAVEIAGDELTMQEVAAAYSRKLGQKVEFIQQPLAELYKMSEDLGRMFEWFDQAGYRAAIPTLRKLHPGLLSFEQWIAQ